MSAIHGLGARQIIALSAWGLVGTLPWSLGFGWLFHHAYLATVGPVKPEPWQFWLLNCGISFSLGLLAGAVIPFLSSNRVVVGWAIFFAALVLSLCMLVAALGGDVALVRNNLTSPGAWSYVIGTLIGAIVTSVLRGRGHLTMRWSGP